MTGGSTASPDPHIRKAEKNEKPDTEKQGQTRRSGKQINK